MAGTNQNKSRLVMAIGIAWTVFCLSGCSSNKPLSATLTLKSDGSQFSGTVVRREPNSITVTSTLGDTRTFLYSELSNVKVGPAEATPVPAAASNAVFTAPVSQPAGAASVATGPAMQFPEGTVFPVRTSGFIDSCCMPVDAISLGTMDEDIKRPDGAVLIPQGANVTIILQEAKTVDGSIQMTFALGSTDFNNRHYMIAPLKSGLDPGAIVVVSGAKQGTPDAKLHGVNVHIDDGSRLVFKAASPVVVKPSQ